MGKSEILLTIVAFVFGISMFVLVSNVISGSNNVISTNRVFNDIKNIKDIVDLEKTMDLNGSGIGTIANNLTKNSSVYKNKNYLKVFQIDSSNNFFYSYNSKIMYRFSSPSVDKYEILIYKQGISEEDINSIIMSESLKKICNSGISNFDTNTIKCGVE